MEHTTQQTFRSALIAVFAGAVLLGCDSSPAEKSDKSELTSDISQEEAFGSIDWPDATWPVSTPDAEGVDGSIIDDVIADMDAGVYGYIDHFLLIRHGRVIVDHSFTHDYEVLNEGSDQFDSQYSYFNVSWHPFYQDTELHTLQSATKSVISAVLGIAVDQGFIKNTEMPAISFLVEDQPDLSDSRKAAITIEDLLTMRSGIQWQQPGQEYFDGSHPTVVMENSDNWIEYILQKPMAGDPGNTWNYDDGASVLLGKVVTESTGQRADQFAKENLFEPIGISDFYWKISPDGEVDTEGGLYLNTYDLARFAYLFLRKGMWNEERIISEEWVNRSITPHVNDVYPDSDKVDFGYGYQWWILDHENGKAKVYAALGFGGQIAVVAPEYDLLAVLNSWSIHTDEYWYPARGLFQDRLIPAVKE